MTLSGALFDAYTSETLLNLWAQKKNLSVTMLKQIDNRMAIVWRLLIVMVILLVSALICGITKQSILLVIALLAGMLASVTIAVIIRLFFFSESYLDALYQFLEDLGELHKEGSVFYHRRPVPDEPNILKERVDDFLMSLAREIQAAEASTSKPKRPQETETVVAEGVEELMARFDHLFELCQEFDLVESNKARYFTIT